MNDTELYKLTQFWRPNDEKNNRDCQGGGRKKVGRPKFVMPFQESDRDGTHRRDVGEPIVRIVHELQRPRAVHNHQVSFCLTNQARFGLEILIAEERDKGCLD